MSPSGTTNSEFCPERGFLDGFKAGLTEKSWMVLVGSLAFSILALGVISFRCSERQLANAPESHLLAYSGDDYGRLTHRILRSASHRDNSQMLVLMGSSGFHESLTGPDDLDRRWRSAAGDSFQTEVLTAHQFSFEERMAAVERYGPFQGIAVISIHPRDLYRAAFQIEEIFDLDRLGFSSADPASLFEADVPKPTGWNYYDHRRFFSARPMLMTGLRRNPVAHEWHHFHEKPRSLAEMRRILLHDDWYQPRDLEWNLQLLRRLIDSLQRFGVTVVLVEVPSIDSVDPAASKPAFEARRRSYRDAIGTITRQTGVTYLDFVAETGLKISDFADPWHISTSSARMRFTEEFVRRMTPLARPKL